MGGDAEFLGRGPFVDFENDVAIGHDIVQWGPGGVGLVSHGVWVGRCVLTLPSEDETDVDGRKKTIQMKRFHV